MGRFQRTTGATAACAATALLVMALAACQGGTSPQPVQPVITFSQMPPIELDVGSIEVINEYVPPLRAPHVEHEFPIKIAAVAERWARERLRASGTGRTARVVIKDASAVETELEQDSGLRSVFTAEQAERYDARIEMVVEVRSDRGFREGFAAASAQRSRTVPEGVSINDRDRVFIELTEGLIQDLNAELEKNIRAFMPLFVR